MLLPNMFSKSYDQHIRRYSTQEGGVNAFDGRDAAATISAHILLLRVTYAPHFFYSLSLYVGMKQFWHHLVKTQSHTRHHRVIVQFHS